MRTTASYELAEDLAQETSLQLYQALRADKNIEHPVPPLLLHVVRLVTESHMLCIVMCLEIEDLIANLGRLHSNAQAICEHDHLIILRDRVIRQMVLLN